MCCTDKQQLSCISWQASERTCRKNKHAHAHTRAAGLPLSALICSSLSRPVPTGLKSHCWMNKVSVAGRWAGAPGATAQRFACYRIADEPVAARRQPPLCLEPCLDLDQVAPTPTGRSFISDGHQSMQVHDGQQFAIAHEARQNSKQSRLIKLNVTYS